MELAEGVILDGHYRLRQLLGRGGMGEVWEAEHTRLPKHFAIKFLHGVGKSDPELLMRFKREAEIASRLAHPSIVQVTDFNSLPDGAAYLVMERLIGEDLRARLDRGALPLVEAREITRQVASALSLAHEAGVVHRDLKPENIFLCREPDGALRAKVLDFGISKLQQSATQSGVTRDDRVLGTPGYMAPEQALGKNSSIDGRTDLFALATILYEMLTGQGVFRGDTLAELCTKVLYHMPPPLDEVLPVPRSLAVAVAQALSKDPNQRQSDIRTFADQVVHDRAAAESAAIGFSKTVASDASGTPPFVPDAGERGRVTASDAVTRSARPSEQATSHKAALPKAAVGGAAALVAVLVAAFAWTRSEPEATPLEPTSVTTVPALPEPSRAPPHGDESEERTGIAVPRANTPSDASAEATIVRDAAPEAMAETHKSGQAGPRRAESALSPAARAALDDAERALQRGDAEAAIRLARGSLREVQSERAYAIMARAYCARHDLGMVQAMLRNLSPAQRKQVQKECQP